MTDWRREILANVSSVEYHGATPGFIIVYGENSDAILSNRTLETLIAAGEIGKGRVVVFPHDVFTTNFRFQELPKWNKTLLENVRSWVTRGRADAVAMDADHVNDFTSIPDNRFLYWSSVRKSDAFLKQLLEWVENGGGLVCGVCPWGKAQVTGLSYEEFATSFIMRKLGMCYARFDEYFSTSGSLSVTGNCAEISRIDRAVQLLRQPAEADRLKKITRNISCIPVEAKLYMEAADTVKAIAAELSSRAPTKGNPISSQVGKRVSELLNLMMLQESQSGKAVVAEGREEFPGEFDQPPNLETATVYVSGKEGRVIPTGCYLPAGVELVLSWSAESGEANGWSVIVGAHTDENFSVKEPWRRWPKISVSEELGSSTLKLRNPFGGLVYLKSPKSEGKLRVTLSNVVPAPRFTYETARDWENVESKKPGLWCDISGELLTITLPSKAIRDVKDPGSVMRMWDNVVRAHMELRGCDPSLGRGQWTVADEQPVAGYMHAGYPIVTKLDVVDPNRNGGKYFLLNVDGLINPKTQDGGLWGMFHELGHNFQNDWWTWGGTGEVTCNIFTLHAMDTIYNRILWIHPWLSNQLYDARRYFADGVSFKTWKEKAGLALFIYAQLARDFGWDAYKKVFREYDALPKSAKPDDDEEEIKQWIIRFSRTTGRNVSPLFEFWGFPYTDRVQGSLRHLPPYLPSDTITKEFGQRRAEDIARKYKIEI